jgi:tetratricopeptide (TPR) repeat protein
VALRGGTLGMLGRFDEGRAALQRARDIAESIGSKALGTAFPFQAGFLELFAGDLDAAARNLRAGYEFNKAVGEKNRFSSLAALLAFCVQEDDVAAAEALLAEAEEAATSDDEDTHAIVAATRSVLARRGGDPDEAVIQAQRAIALAESRDAWAKGIWFEELAEARAAAGDVPAAREAYEAALQIFRRKEVPTLVERAERRLAEL